MNRVEDLLPSREECGVVRTTTITATTGRESISPSTLAPATTEMPSQMELSSEIQVNTRGANAVVFIFERAKDHTI